ncbi:MAG: ribosomal RNA small subunit methyltransferase A [Deltaproteobacteria bacterium]|nr:ribosomal RNA small subunit methyltransferase A [Deltaproteobacteria bacterium]MBW1930306.1 ribosomal RNA small subunit methyltransferase A [Deltaproteobacteria bacterium]MBW2025271.1 ribosomal RNA small subunit methyltransferase A [Deltaproteobacteria bacterium]MBW2125290.1 ribosomal RNA small subunit methyltransferase A [Deltaproteobacteria bacterium]RLB15083.1 MAG: ribosomal RNA small subunit methyltransferase A [Deltaproteobacteria bacterium]
MNDHSRAPQHMVFHPKKRLGQCFLVNRSIAQKIIAHSRFGPSDTVLEIGPGMGALTIALARIVRHVVAIEKDPELFKRLEMILHQESLNNVTLILGDILKLDFEELKEFFETKILALGNLPYNISSPLVAKLVANRQCMDRAILMFQREFAERLISGPGSKSYGAITVMLRYRARARKLFKVSSGSFVPRPKVESMVVELDFNHPWPHAPVSDKELRRVVKPAFSQRRKTLINALLGAPGTWDRETLLAAMESCGINPSRRAETLEPDEFICLANALKLTIS